MLLLFWRALLSGLILLPFALAIGPRLSVRLIRDQALFGFMAMFLYLGVFALAIEQKVPTGLVALISDLLPLATAAPSHPMLGKRLTLRRERQARGRRPDHAFFYRFVEASLS
jgi:drug/metabolite transporter (DMT)-like permease